MTLAVRRNACSALLALNTSDGESQGTPWGPLGAAGERPRVSGLTGHCKVRSLCTLMLAGTDAVRPCSNRLMTATAYVSAVVVFAFTFFAFFFGGS